MTDEQMARQFMDIVGALESIGSEVDVLAETFNQIRIEERARCVAIVEQYTVDHMPGPTQLAARGILHAIREE